MCISPFGYAMHRLLIRQFFSLFAQFKTTTKSHENYVFLYLLSNMAISPQNNERKKPVFYTGKLYGLTGMCYYNISVTAVKLTTSKLVNEDIYIYTFL